MSEPRLSDEQRGLIEHFIAQFAVSSGPPTPIWAACTTALAEVRHLRARVAALEDMAARMARDDPAGFRDAGAAQEREACATLCEELAANYRRAHRDPGASGPSDAELFAAAVEAASRAIRARGPCLPDLPEVAELERLRKMEVDLKKLVEARPHISRLDLRVFLGLAPAPDYDQADFAPHFPAP